jgi:hypothetical protein
VNKRRKTKTWKREPEIDRKTADHLFPIQAESSITPFIGQGRTPRHIHHYHCNLIVTFLENKTGRTHKTHPTPTPTRTRNKQNKRRTRKEDWQRTTHKNKPKGATIRVEGKITKSTPDRNSQIGERSSSIMAEQRRHPCESQRMEHERRKDRIRQGVAATLTIIIITIIILKKNKEHCRMRTRDTHTTTATGPVYMQTEKGSTRRDTQTIKQGRQ